MSDVFHLEIIILALWRNVYLPVFSAHVCKTSDSFKKTGTHGKLSKLSGAWSEIGADPWVMRIVQWGYKIPFVTLPPLRLQGQETTYPKGSLKWSSLNQELRNKGAIEPAPLTPGFYSRLFLVRKATGEWRPIIDLSSLNVFVHCPSCTMETPRSILRALQQGQWLTSQDLKDAYFHIWINLADRCYLRFCHNGTAWQFTVLPFGLSTSPRVFTKILKTCTSLCPPTSGKAAHVFR